MFKPTAPYQPIQGCSYFAKMYAIMPKMCLGTLDFMKSLTSTQKISNTWLLKMYGLCLKAFENQLYLFFIRYYVQSTCVKQVKKQQNETNRLSTKINLRPTHTKQCKRAVWYNTRSSALIQIEEKVKRRSLYYLDKVSTVSSLFQLTSGPTAFRAFRRTAARLERFNNNFLIST